MQETLIAYWKRFGALPWEHPEGGDSYEQAWAWCCLKVRSLALNRRNSAYHRYERLLLNDQQGESLAVVDEAEHSIERIAIGQFITSLPDYLRSVAVMYEAGYSYSEIAAHLGVSVGTVQGYLGRIQKLGRAFFGLDGNKQGFCVVNSGESPREGETNLSQEVQNDETTQDAVERSECTGSRECRGASPHPCRARRNQRGGGGLILQESLLGSRCEQPVFPPMTEEQVRRQVENHIRLLGGGDDDLEPVPPVFIPPGGVELVPSPKKCCQFLREECVRQYFCRDIPEDCGRIFQRHRWYVRFVCSKVCDDGQLYYGCTGWLPTPEDGTDDVCCQWSDGADLPSCRVDQPQPNLCTNFVVVYQ